MMVLAAAVTAAGCAAAGTSPAEPGNDPADAFQTRAAAVAAAWRAGPATAWRQGFVPLQDLTVPPAGATFTEATKLAFTAGWYRSTVVVTAEQPPDGTITFGAGGTLPVPLVPALTAYQAIDLGDPPCLETQPSIPPPPGPGGAPDASVSSGPLPGQCQALTVTGVRLGTVALRTSRGEAQVPAWLFTVAELSGEVARVAVAPSAVSPLPTFAPPDPPTQPVTNLVAAQDITAVRGAELAFRLGVGACDTAITPLSYESDDVLVVGGSVVRGTGICTEQLLLHPVTVTFKAPVGDRVVLDALTGQPLSVRTP